MYQAIVELLGREGLYGATVQRVVGGYDSSSRYHKERVLRLSQDLPVIIEVIEYSERIERILPQLDGRIDRGLITLEEAHVILYRANKDADKAAR